MMAIWKGKEKSDKFYQNFLTKINLNSRHDYRYDAVLMRARFDANKDIKDMRKAAALVAAGEEEVFQKTDYDPFIYRNDEHGITYSRQPHIRDDLLDLWHPWEKVRDCLEYEYCAMVDKSSVTDKRLKSLRNLRKYSWNTVLRNVLGKDLVGFFTNY